MIYTVKRIDEDLDFGCEERPKGMPVMAIVTLTNSSGEEIRIKAEDAMLYECNINEGDKVSLDVNNKLEKAAKRLRPVEPKKGYFWMVVCIILGFVVGAYIQQYVMGPVGGLCVGVIVDEAVYKIRMKRFISKGGIPTKPEKPEEKPAETAEDDAKEKKEKM